MIAEDKDDGLQKVTLRILYASSMIGLSVLIVATTTSNNSTNRLYVLQTRQPRTSAKVL